MDQRLMLEAAAAAGLTAAAIVLLCSLPWRRPRATRTALGLLLGMAGAFYLGSWMLKATFQLSLAEDTDRWLLILFPAVIVAELAAILPGRFRLLAWPLRLVVAAGATRILLHGSTFITDHEGAPREWTPDQTWLILGGLAAALLAVWGLLDLLAKQSRGQSVPLALALVCAGAAVTTMFSGYLTGGAFGLPLAAALAGAAVATFVLPECPDLKGVLGLGIVGLFALLVMGRFFGKLSTTNAVLLFAAPLLCWLPELPPRFRGFGRLLLAAIPVVIVVSMALAKFIEDSKPPSTGPKERPAGSYEYSPGDYESFGK